jgi:pimeloyl-ACP methyl ester carboxylesterase
VILIVTHTSTPQDRSYLHQPTPYQFVTQIISAAMLSRSAPTHPVVLLVHGAWQTPSHYHPLIHAITASDFSVICPPLPSCSNAIPNTANLIDDIALIRATAVDLAGRGHPIIALMHSYGGGVGTQALSGLGWNERAKHQQSGGVVALVYMASVTKALTGQLPPVFRRFDDGTYGMDDFWLRLYSTDVSPPPTNYTFDSSVLNPMAAEKGWPNRPFPGPPATSPLNPSIPAPSADSLMAALTGHSKAPEIATQSIPAYSSSGMHVTYLVCERDMALPANTVQRGTIAQIRAEGVEVVEEVCQGGHSPFLSVPGEVAAVTERAWQRWVEADSKANQPATKLNK